MALEVTKKALEDAHLSRDDIDTVVYSIYCEMMERQYRPDQFLHDYLGMTGKPGIRHDAAAAGGNYTINEAVVMIASGMIDVLLIVAIQKGQDFYSFETKSRGDGFLKGMYISSEGTWVQPVFPSLAALLTLMTWVPHLEKYGNPTPEQVAKGSAKNHRNALPNPYAQLKMDLSVEDVMNSRIIGWPTTMYECCLMSDGAAAMILASEEKARQITDKPIWVSGIGVSNYPSNHLAIDDLGRMKGVNMAAKAAYKMAGITKPLEELDVIELHDIISANEPMTYEELGLCALGEGGSLLDEGITEMTGSLPVNPSGGRVACGHVASVSAMMSSCSVVLQLREEVPGIQVPIRKGRGLVEAIDGIASLSSVTVFERDR
jgi:acetyl-CoA acetyltransferase